MAIDILVVEDEYTERQELTQLLETVTPPEHIRSAATCSAAIAAISQLCPDLILLDIMLRGSSGFEVAEFVRSNRLDCKIIILTAYHEFDFASKALSMDLQDYLLKPVRPSVLLQRVRDVLHLSSPARAATGLAVWPYLACGISSPLPPILVSSSSAAAVDFRAAREREYSGSDGFSSVAVALSAFAGSELSSTGAADLPPNKNCAPIARISTINTRSSTRMVRTCALFSFISHFLRYSSRFAANRITE